MKRIICLITLILLKLSAVSQEMTAEDYYFYAFNSMADMLAGKDTLSIKRAVFMAEWAYLEGELDYEKDFCNEINRITAFLNKFYDANRLSSYKTGKQIAINDYFFKPYSGNGYTPYTYDFEYFSKEESDWEGQFVSKVLKTHKGQCRSLPWMYKILAKEIGADVSIAHAPGHCYIMYRDEDNFTPEEWINLEVTTNQMVPAWWIKQDFEICDSAVLAGTYMTPLTDVQTVASQMAELAFGYVEKFKRYDDFSYWCSTRSLEFYPMNPNAWIIRGKSLDRILQDYLERNGHIYDSHVAYLETLIADTMCGFDKTYMTPISVKFEQRMRQRSTEAQKYLQNKKSPE